MVRDLCQQTRGDHDRDLPHSLFALFTDLIEADVSERLARELVERVRREVSDGDLADPVLVKARLAGIIESDISVAGPIATTPGRHRLVALVGPTGVGKTTTIAKLAANYRLKKRQNVGLITVDTYRVAAVEQLRTYADIIDLPMQVVSTPREMREAVHRLSGMDLILMDTAGRSPRDEIKIQELKALLTEADADEVHLVLSSVAGERTLEQTAEQFSVVGTTAMILTKLDEATGLGNLLPVLRASRLPLSYLTNGQNVPDDIETAQAPRLAQLILGGGTDYSG
jgi:flagellar biosynthesis protein FlhF